MQNLEHDPFVELQHKDHIICVDEFAKLQGVSRSIPGNAWCQTCGTVVAGYVVDDYGNKIN